MTACVGRLHACLLTVLVLTGCRSPEGLVVEGRVAFADGRPAVGGEIWLEPDEPAVAGIRPARAVIRDGRFRFSAESHVQAGRWVARVYAPPLGSLSGEDELEASFEDLHQPITIAAANGRAELQFTVSRRTNKAQPRSAGRRSTAPDGR